MTSLIFLLDSAAITSPNPSRVLKVTTSATGWTARRAAGSQRVGDVEVTGHKSEQNDGFGPFLPNVVFPIQVFGGPGVRLAPSPAVDVNQRRAAKPFWIGPRVLPPVAKQFGGTLIQYAASPRQARATHSKLRQYLPPPPLPPPLEHDVRVTLAYSRRGKPLSHFSGPTVVYGTLAWGFIAVNLVRIRPPLFHSKLRPPAVTAAVDTSTFGGPRIKLVPPRATNPSVRSRLQPPTVVSTGAVFYGPRVDLIRIRPVRTIARLLTVPAAFRPVGILAVHLAADSPRGKAKPRLVPPAVVAPVLARPILEHLAYSRRGKPRSRLFPPAVVAPVLAQPISTTFVRIRPVPVDSILRRPIDLVDRDDLGTTRIHLAYSLRGKPKSRLSPPAAVAPVLARHEIEALVRIRPVPVYSVLRPPQVVFTAVELSGPEVTLTYSRRGVAKSVLAPASLFTPQPYADTTILIHLAYSLRGQAKSRLRQVVYGAKVYAPISVTLAPQTRGRPKSILRPPSVVARALFEPTISVTLAPSKRGKPRSFLKPPTVVRAEALAAAITVTLVRIRPPRTRWSLTPPTVVFTGPSFGGPRVKLVTPRATRPILRYRLAPPAVVQPRVIYPPITTHLVRIRPVATHSILRPPTVVIEVCFGCVTGFDYAAWATGGDDAACVAGDDTGALVAGSDSAGTALGAAAPGGNVDGGDARREGC